VSEDPTSHTILLSECLCPARSRRTLGSSFGPDSRPDGTLPLRQRNERASGIARQWVERERLRHFAALLKLIMHSRLA